MRTTRYTLPIFLLFWAGIALAQDDFDPAARAEAIAPYLDSQTIAVGHVDLTAVEPDVLVDKFVQLVPEAGVEVAELRANLNLAHSAFTQAGFTDLYVVASLADIPARLPFLIAPKSDRSNFALLRKLLSRPETWWIDEQIAELPGAIFIGSGLTRAPGTVFVGNPKSLERLKDINPDARPELARAFQAAGNTAIQLLLIPTAGDRRVIEELMPTLPREIGAGPSTILTQGAQWLALGVDAPPNISLRLTIQSKDGEAAAAFHAKWQEVAQLLSQPEMRLKTLRGIDRAVALLTPRVEGDRLVLSLSEKDRSIQDLLAAVTPPLEQARNMARRRRSMNRLKVIALAMHRFHNANKRFPAIGTFDASGKPLLSWRVHVLPFVDQKPLYDQFHLGEPWDSEHNRTLIAKMPKVFSCPASKHKQTDGLATYRVVVGEHTVFPGREGIAFKRIIDGTSNTIMAVEVDDLHAVIWTKPEGLPFNEENPAAGLGGQFEGGFNSVFCDGAVHFLELPHDPDRLRYLLMRDDRQTISW